MSHEWMKQLKIGDPVFVKASRRDAHLYKYKVTNITKVYVTVGYSQRWSLKTGRELNTTASFFPNALLQPTPELEACYARQQLISDVSNLLEFAWQLMRDDVEGITDADLQQIKDALDPIVRKHTTSA